MNSRLCFRIILILGQLCLGSSALRASPPNFLFILTDDQRYDALGCAGLRPVETPNLDRLASRGMRFQNAFVTLSICSPSRAAVLTGMYGSANGVTTAGRPRLKPGVRTVANYLKDAGYRTGVAGKWHLGNTPAECGFEFARTFESNGPFYDRQVQIDGKTETVPGFVDGWVAEQSVVFFMGDNGWFLGEHGFTSKVLPYEESIRVPLIMAGPWFARGISSDLVLNIDIPITMLALAGLEPPSGLHGRTLLDGGPRPGMWTPPFRTSFLYEAPDPQPGSHPLWAVRTKRWKYIRTGSPEDPEQLECEELYDLRSDPQEMHNLADDAGHGDTLEQLQRLLRQHRKNPADDADPNWAAALNGNIAVWMARAEGYLNRGKSRMDRVEAYATYRLAARHGSAEAQARMAELEQTLSATELRVARIECTQCRRNRAEEAGIAPSLSFRRLTLNGVVVAGQKRTALIGGRAIQVGETVNLRAPPYDRVRVECLEIGLNWVRLGVDGREVKLSLPDTHPVNHPGEVE